MLCMLCHKAPLNMEVNQCTTNEIILIVTLVTCALTDCSDTGPEDVASASFAWTVPILLKSPRRHLVRR